MLHTRVLRFCRMHSTLRLQESQIVALFSGMICTSSNGATIRAAYAREAAQPKQAARAKNDAAKTSCVLYTHVLHDVA